MSLKKKELTSFQNIAESLAVNISADDTSTIAQLIFNDLVFIGTLRNIPDEDIVSEPVLEQAARVYSDSLRLNWIDENTTFGDFIIQSLNLAKNPTY